MTRVERYCLDASTEDRGAQAAQGAQGAETLELLLQREQLALLCIQKEL